ncbi:MAG: hypothetical protein JSS61_00750 [Verrucomicrobia bacterium]|nr:hypothetical protein [Verrucomicrobiota bacterium]
MSRLKLLALGLVACSLYGAMPAPEDNDENLDLFCKNRKVYFIDAEFLYWGVNEGATDFALKMNHPAWSSTTSTYAVGKYHSANFSWEPGFRVSFGYFNAPHYWDVYGQYTYLRARGTDEVHAPSDTGKYLLGTWIEPDFGTTGATTPLKKAHSSIEFDYNVIDLLFTRRFHTNPHLRLNVFGGGTAAIFDQDWDVHYTDLNNYKSKIENDWNFGGAGIRLGMRVDWFMGWDIYLTGTGSGAVLAGVYENKAKQTTNAPVAGADNEIPFRNTHFRDTRLTYTAQLLAGPSWQKAFKSVRAEITCAYEFTVWTNLHNIYRSSLAGPQAGKDTYINSSNVSLQGLTVRFNLDF